ncbi:carboxypeptidase-like regulatory domain-containing protein [Flavobacterium sp. C3NV]|uniref:carboxypeptidase-like regulatory domain-containing protein n=1 Tax=Flavobacterium sp. C3NV TaxID=3393358 RepID=UPI0039900C54
MKFTNLLLLFLIAFNCFSQEKTISGEIKDAQTNSILEYVNVGINNKNAGTVSNSQGIFNLKLNDKVGANDTIVFSYVGYNSKKIIVNQLKQEKNLILLEPSDNMLKEVVIKFKQPKPKQFGRSAKGLSLMHSNFYYALDKDVDDRLSRERGMKFKIKKDCKLSDFNFNITSNEFKSVKFRLNFYKIENDLPTNLIVDKDIIFEVKNGFRGLYTLDLNPFDIYLDKEMGDIAVTIQWIESVKENEKSKFFAISTAMSATETSFYREKNRSNWYKSGQSLTFYLNAMCQ